MDKQNIPSGNGSDQVVQVIDVVKSFPVGGGEVTILKGISFDVKPGEFVSIVGPSGNGKSTLLNMITGIDRPTGGEVIVTGREIHRMSENNWQPGAAQTWGSSSSSSRCCRR